MLAGQLGGPEVVVEAAGVTVVVIGFAVVVAATEAVDAAGTAWDVVVVVVDVVWPTFTTTHSRTVFGGICWSRLRYSEPPTPKFSDVMLDGQFRRIDVVVRTPEPAGIVVVPSIGLAAPEDGSVVDDDHVTVIGREVVATGPTMELELVPALTTMQMAANCPKTLLKVAKYRLFGPKFPSTPAGQSGRLDGAAEDVVLAAEPVCAPVVEVPELEPSFPTFATRHIATRFPVLTSTMEYIELFGPLFPRVPDGQLAKGEAVADVLLTEVVAETFWLSVP
jgi:hypothetical protein